MLVIEMEKRMELIWVEHLAVLSVVELVVAMVVLLVEKLAEW